MKHAQFTVVYDGPASAGFFVDAANGPELAAPVCGFEAVEVWHACDEAAVDAGFAEAALPERPLSVRVVRQMAGGWQERELVGITSPTATGTVFCMTGTDRRVVLYKFNGRDIIRRD